MRIIDTIIKYTHNPDNDLTADEREEKCCEPLNGIECGKSGKVVAWDGQDDQSHWPPRTKLLVEQSKTDPLVEIRYKPRTQPCGYKEIKWEGSENCCAGIDSLYWVKTYDVLEWNKQYVFIVEGGAPPYYWSTQGKGLSVSGSGASATVTVSDCFCKPGQIIVTDACDQQIVHSVTSEEGFWSEIANPHQFTGAGIDTGINPTNGTSVIRQQNDEFKTEQIYTRFSYNYPGWTWAEVKAFACPNMVENFTVNYREPDVYPPDDWIACAEGGDDWVWYKEGEFEGRLYTLISGSNSVVPGYPTGSKGWEWDCGLWNELLYDTENSADVIADNSSAWIFWEGGKPPFWVEVDGQGFYLDASHQLQAFQFQERKCRVYTSDACGYCQVTVVDNCGDTVYGDVSAADGNWEEMLNTGDTCYANGLENATYTHEVWSPYHDYVIEQGGYRTNLTLVETSDASGEAIVSAPTFLGCDAHCPTAWQISLGATWEGVTCGIDMEARHGDWWPCWYNGYNDRVTCSTLRSKRNWRWVC